MGLEILTVRQFLISMTQHKVLQLQHTLFPLLTCICTFCPIKHTSQFTQNYVCNATQTSDEIQFLRMAPRSMQHVYSNVNIHKCTLFWDLSLKLTLHRLMSQFMQIGINITMFFMHKCLTGYCENSNQCSSLFYQSPKNMGIQENCE